MNTIPEHLYVELETKIANQHNWVQHCWKYELPLKNYHTYLKFYKKIKRNKINVIQTLKTS